MKRVYQNVPHNPPDSYGDCHRCCLASILELPASRVPHFLADGDPNEEFNERIRKWLHDRGVPYFTIPFEGGSPLEFMAMQNPGVFYILGGKSPLGNHSVVALNDQIVHDPQARPAGQQIIGPMSDGLYVVDIVGSFKALKGASQPKKG